MGELLTHLHASALPSNDALAFPSLRGMNAVRDEAICNPTYINLATSSLRESETNEAIHNQAKINFYNGILKKVHYYGLPRDSNESLAMTGS